MNPQAPSKATLDKYGLTLQEWLFMAGDKCPICERSWAGRRAVVDHEHVRGWKKMAPSTRRLYVRGVTCISCNHFVLTRYGSIIKHLNAAQYLRDYAKRWLSNSN